MALLVALLQSGARSAMYGHLKLLLSLVLLGLLGSNGQLLAEPLLPDRNQQHTFAMAPAPLYESLQQYSLITRQSVLYESRLLRGKRSSGLHGRYSSTEALQLLLRDTGLQFQFTASGFLLQLAGPPTKKALPTQESMQRYELMMRRKLVSHLCQQLAGQAVRQRIALQVWLDEQARVGSLRVHVAQRRDIEEKVRIGLTGLYLGHAPHELAMPVTLILEPGTHSLVLCAP